MTSKKARYINPPNKLKAKVGNGGIDLKLVDKAQSYIENTAVDFEPIALQFLEDIKNDIKNLIETRSLEAKEKLAADIMQLKANGGMFRFQLVSEIGNIALRFVEDLDVIHDDCIDVLNAHEKTIQIIIAHKLTGDGGKAGLALVKELEKACHRFFKKYKVA